MSGRSVVVTMGVAGSGKTTLGQALAARLGVPFQEGDEMHPPANVARMRAGTPLTDADRAPWLDAVAGWIADRGERGGVVSCSALKRTYRDRLRAAGAGRLRFVLLEADPATLRARIAARAGHFMPASLLDSQLATLEPPTTEPDAIGIDGTAPAAGEVERIVRWLGGEAATPA